MNISTLSIAILLAIVFTMSGICGEVEGIGKVIADIYVDAENGSNDNWGESPDDALRTITYALFLYEAYASPRNTLNIHVAPGYYGNKHGERFPITIDGRNVHFIGAGPGETFLGGWSGDGMSNTGTIMIFQNVDDAGIDGFTLKGGGFGIKCYNANPWINNCEIRDLLYHNGTFILIYGGNSGIYCDNSSPLVTNCIITKCRGGNYCYFYPIHAVDSSPLVVNCLIMENTLNMDTRIFLEGSSHPRFVNCTIANNINIYGEDETAIFVSKGCTLKLINSILWKNGPEPISGQGIVKVIYSDIMRGWSGEGNIDVNPLFVEGPLGNYYLSHGETHGFYSRCIDAGTEVMTFGLDAMTTRTDGVFDTGRVDMGYHYPSEN